MFPRSSVPRVQQSCTGCMENQSLAFGLTKIANERLELGSLNIIGKQVIKIDTNSVRHIVYYSTVKNMAAVCIFEVMSNKFNL